jgi:hypothetical protein
MRKVALHKGSKIKYSLLPDSLFSRFLAILLCQPTRPASQLSADQALSRTVTLLSYHYITALAPLTLTAKSVRPRV